MNSYLTLILSIIAIFAIYWVFVGQRKYNEMLMPKKKREIKAVIFDMDGVILDSKEAWLKVFNSTRKKFNLPEISEKEFAKKVWGGSVESDAKKYFKNKSVGEMGKIYIEEFYKFTESTKLMPNAKEVLQKIREKRLKIGLVTNTYKKSVKKTLEYHKIKDYFDAIVCGDEVEKDKPYPDEIIEACKRLKINVDEAILVGDTKNDIIAGRAAGCFVIGYNIMADLRISGLSDLLEMV